MTKRLIIASNRLPVSVREEHGVLCLSRSNGGLATALASLFNQDNSLWVGWTGMHRRLSQKELAELALPGQFVPINLTQKEIVGYYYNFSNGILWPLAHGLERTARHVTEPWRLYQAVNERFANAIARVIQPDDTVWVHDYHLLLLPGLLRERGITNKIGFFLHTPFFPASMLNSVPHLDTILQKLQSADLIGFQTPTDVARLRAACRRLKLPLPKNVQAFPIGIDFEQFDSQADNPAVLAEAAQHTSAHSGRTIIFSLSRLDYTKGILTQLAAYELLIRTTSQPERLVYRLNVAPSREQGVEYRRLKRQIEHRVSAINRRFGTTDWQPVHYTYENLGVQAIAAWYQVADIHLNTPLADGMNLIAKEYIAARRKPGVLIISSTMGAAVQLTDALIVPPDDPKATSESLQAALTMNPTERARRWKNLRHGVKNNQASDWSASFLDRLC